MILYVVLYTNCLDSMYDIEHVITLVRLPPWGSPNLWEAVVENQEFNTKALRFKNQGFYAESSWLNF